VLSADAARLLARKGSQKEVEGYILGAVDRGFSETRISKSLSLDDVLPRLKEEGYTVTSCEGYYEVRW